jgi:hypothetical protein
LEMESSYILPKQQHRRQRRCSKSVPGATARDFSHDERPFPAPTAINDDKAVCYQSPIGLSPCLRNTSLKASAINAWRLLPWRRASVCMANDISGVKNPAICLRP